MTDNENVKAPAPGRVGGGAKFTAQAPPRIISKKWLCATFDCQFPGGRFNYRRLYRVVLTSQVLTAAGLDPQQVRRTTFREFDAVASAKLREILSI